jgi:hypothetical protein
VLVVHEVAAECVLIPRAIEATKDYRSDFVTVC